MNARTFERYFVGDDCVCWSFADRINVDVNRRVLYLYRKLAKSTLSRDLPIRDIVPSYKALAVYFDPGTGSVPEMIDTIEAFILANIDSRGVNHMPDAKSITLPVIYDGEDLARVAGFHGLTVQEVIKKHTAPAYQVAMVGFRPHFPYLIGLDKDLETPRLDNPRVSIPAGTVGIGGAQTGIYPENSPGGWNLIGRNQSGIS